MIEMLIKKRTLLKVPTEIDIGPMDPIAGNEEMGFFGELSTSNFITGNELANRLNITEGRSQHSNDAWLKFYRHGKLLFISRKNFREAITWQHLYQCGAVYGDDSYGPYPSGGQRLQNARVEIRGHIFKVRLMTVAGGDPYSGAINVNVTSDTLGSEWDDLLYRVNLDAPHYPGEQKWYNLTEADLNINYNGRGFRSLGIESHASSLDYCLSRGYRNSGDIHRRQKHLTDWGFGWRPVLEPDE